MQEMNTKLSGDISNLSNSINTKISNLESADENLSNSITNINNKISDMEANDTK